MNNEISWHVKLLVQPSELDNFCTLSREMLTDAKTESGMLIYERFLSEDCSKVFVYERYSNSTAALAHLHGFQQKFSERFSGMVQREYFIVFGNPSQDLKDMLDKLGAEYAVPLLATDAANG